MEDTTSAVRASIYIATSLDGFIAREDGDIDWLHAAGDAGGEDYGYADFMATVDALVIGRNTYDKVRTFGQWPYGDTRVVVVTHRPVGDADELPPTVSFTSEALPGLVGRLGQEGARHLYVDGGQLIQSFLREGLIQQLIITRIPILIGSGIPLFGRLEQDIRLRHVETRSFPTGLVQSRYEVVT